MSFWPYPALGIEVISCPIEPGCMALPPGLFEQLGNHHTLTPATSSNPAPSPGHQEESNQAQCQHDTDDNPRHHDPGHSSRPVIHSRSGGTGLFRFERLWLSFTIDDRPGTTGQFCPLICPTLHPLAQLG